MCLYQTPKNKSGPVYLNLGGRLVLESSLERNHTQMFQARARQFLNSLLLRMPPPPPPQLPNRENIASLRTDNAAQPTPANDQNESRHNNNQLARAMYLIDNSDLDLFQIDRSVLARLEANLTRHSTIRPAVVVQMPNELATTHNQTTNP